PPLRSLPCSYTTLFRSQGRTTDPDRRKDDERPVPQVQRVGDVTDELCGTPIQGRGGPLSRDDRRSTQHRKQRLPSGKGGRIVEQQSRGDDRDQPHPAQRRTHPPRYPHLRRDQGEQTTHGQ